MALSNAQMVLLLREALAKNVGVVSVNIDGRQVSFNRQQAISELNFWERRLARENGTRPLFVPVKL